MKTLILLLLLLSMEYFGQAQPCTHADKLKQTGYWTKGLEGSKPMVAPADLARQKATVNNIIQSIQKKYTPRGLDILYVGAYMDQSRLPSHIPAGNYYYADFYFLEHDYPYNKEEMKSKQSGGYLSIIANDFGLEFGRSFFVPSKPHEENPRTDAYVLLDEPPVKTDKGWYWKEGGNRTYTTLDYRYLVTTEGKSPLMHMTKKEYAERMKERFQKKMQEAERNYAEQLKSSEETYARLKKLSEKDANTFKQQNDIVMNQTRATTKTFYEKQIPLIEKFLQTTDAKTLGEPAIIDHVKGESEFYGFVNADHPNAMWAVRPNADYFNPKLPKSSPQFFTVHFSIYKEDKETVHDVAMQDLLKVIDFASLKSMIGK
jgi:hypothetical protein